MKGDKRKLDNRIRVLIENGVKQGHRSMLVLVGEEGREELVVLHHILSKATFKARPSVLWCYKRELGFSTHRKKQMRELAKRLKTGAEGDEDPFQLFLASTNIRYCYYSETSKILGNTYGMVVLQDFEALTPNLLARTIETVEGGGLVVFLLKGLHSLRQLYSLAMDVHSRYRTEAQRDVVCRFNERFILSLGSCPAALVLDQDLRILPLSTHARSIKALEARKAGEETEAETELRELKDSLKDTKGIGPLLRLAKTLDQGKALLKLLDLVTEKSLRQTASLTAARGRGKSAALGLSVAGAVVFGYSNIFLTSPSPENLRTLFHFIVKGLEALDYQEHMDYELVQSTEAEFGGAVVRLNVFRDHRQTVQYICPTDAAKLGQCELLVVDEAAAIPLPLVRRLLGPYLVFLASTINGYEGTGRSLSLKLIAQLRAQQASASASQAKGQDAKDAQELGRTLHELTLDESIRYSAGDQVEAWLNRLLCLDPGAVTKLGSGAPAPAACSLYYVNRDTLFSFHPASELFLQRLMSIYVAAHYKNSPNDLQMLSDAPAHHLFCLLGPRLNPSALPEILCVLQVCLEGELSKDSVEGSFARGKRASGDMIPWTLAQQFQDNDFPSLAGARVVRIATHPDYQGMGYGSRALTLLQQYYRGDIVSIKEDDDEPQSKRKRKEAKKKAEEGGEEEEELKPRKDLPPLLSALSERRPERLDWLGVSFGLTSQLLKFWKKQGMAPLYLRQTPNELTGEHSTIMLCLLAPDAQLSGDWLLGYWRDFRRRFIRLLGMGFRGFRTDLALSMLQRPTGFPTAESGLSRDELRWALSDGDLRRLELYSKNLVDHHLVSDLLPSLAQLYFTERLGSVRLSPAQAAILLGMGLEAKSVEDVGRELDVPVSQLLALFNKAVKKAVGALNGVCEASVEASEGLAGVEGRAVAEGRAVVVGEGRGRLQSLAKELDEVGRETEAKAAEQRRRLLQEDLSEFRIRAAEDQWTKAAPNPNGILSLKRQADPQHSAPKDPVLDPLQDPTGLLSKKKKRKGKK